MHHLNKKGMTTVFVAIIAGALVSLVIAFVSLSHQEASISYSESVMNLAGRSVLAEYDRELKNRYGLIAFYGQKSEIEEKILKYSLETLDRIRYAKVGDIDVDLKTGSLMDREVFEDEIKEYMEYNLPLILNKEKEKGPVTTGKRVLRNSEIINSLPSYERGYEYEFPDLVKTIKNLSSITDLWKAGTSEYFSMMYIFNFFKTGQNIEQGEDSFFKNEVEYVIEGKYSDEDNLQGIRKKIITIRTALNLIYLSQDQAKQSEALSAAMLITPGPEAEITKALIIAAWAALEADNDWELLLEGRKVPIFKDSASWATDVTSVTESIAGTAYPSTEKGFCYDEYLKILLTAVPDDIKYFRMMDIIQINMKGTYWGNMKIKDMYTQYSFKVDINGREHEYEEKY